MDLLVQLLAFIVFCICQSFSHEDGTRQNLQNYATVNKKIKSKHFVQLGRKRIKAQAENIEKLEIMRNNESLWSSMSFLFAKTSANARLKYPKNKLVVVGPQGSNEADNNTGIAIACGN